MTKSSRNIADLVAKIKAMPRDQYDYLEVKQLAEILARHRAKLRNFVAEYRTLKDSIETQHDAVERLYLGYEAMFLRDHVRDAWRLYRLVSGDFHVAFNVYMKAAANAPTLPSFIYASNDKTPAVSAPVITKVDADTQMTQSRRNVA